MSLRALVLADRDPRNLDSIIAREKPEVLLTLGDLNAWSLVDLRSHPQLPRAGVYGNHCDGTYLRRLGLVNLHAQAGRWLDRTWAGLEGCPVYKSGPFQYTEDQVRSFLAPLPQVDIFLTHCPPLGVNDDPESRSHRGWSALRDYLDRFPPKMLLHGHTGPLEPVSSYGNVEVVYVCGHQMVDLP